MGWWFELICLDLLLGIDEIGVEIMLVTS